MEEEFVSWRQLIEVAMEDVCGCDVNGPHFMVETCIPDNWNNVVHSTLSQNELDQLFDRNYGSINGKPFTLWTKNWVYFPAENDGREWVECVPRNPCNISTEHL